MWYMQRHRENFTEEQYNRRVEYGQESLANYYDKYINTFAKIISPERRINNVVYNGVPLKGMIDKIEFDGYNVNVVDYKTGTPDMKKTAAPDEKQPFGGEYWRQLAFYTILLETAHIYPEKVGKTAISWLEPDKRGAFPVVEIAFSGAELQAMKDTIKTVWNRIQDRDFNTGCGKDDCIWCTMHRTRVFAEGSRGEEEGLDD